MIKVHRTEEPPVLTQNAMQWTNDYIAAQQILDLAITGEAKKAAKRDKNAKEKKYNHPQIKAALRAMFYQGKCAYCESHIAHIGYPHIEHFRPKNLFPDKCFEWNNLLLGCSVCNGAEYKGTKFPLASDGGFLVNPCEEDPDDFFEFVFEKDENSEEGFIAVIRCKNPRGQITELTLGLNRLPLLRKRTQTLVPYYLGLTELAKKGDNDAKSILKRASHPRFEYSAFAKTLLKQLG